MRIGIVVDSACDLPREFLDQHGVLIMPITLRIGDALIEDRRHPEETQAFYARHLDRKSEDFAESIPYSVAQIERLFLERLVLDYDYVFCLTITSTRSPIFDHAMQASRAILTKYKAIRREAGMEERFGLAVFSTRNLFTGQAVPVAEAVRLIRLGGLPSEIGARLKQLIDETHTYLVPADLFHIYKRASKKGDTSLGWSSYTLGTWLDVKPILHCHRDVTTTVDKVRGFYGRCRATVRQGGQADRRRPGCAEHLHQLRRRAGAGRSHAGLCPPGQGRRGQRREITCRR
jgi:fatty acid-binding protein DegV